jgi:hypothetical protein
MPPPTVSEYLKTLPADRRKAVETVCKIVRKHLPTGYEEGIEFGMPSWFVPLSRYPDTYNKRPLQIAAIASQKGHMSLYLMAVYGDPAIRAWFQKAFAGAGKKLDMGKSCVRFKAVDDLPLDVIGEAIARVPVDAYLAKYEAVRKK